MYPEKREQYRRAQREGDYLLLAFVSMLGVLLVVVVYAAYRLVAD